MRLLLFLAFLPLFACTEREASPIEVEARRVIAENGVAAILRAVHSWPDSEWGWTDLAVWPDLSVRGECPESTPLRRWFEERGLSHCSEMDKVLWAGVRGLGRWRAVDWEARVREAARENPRRPPLPALEAWPEWKDGEGHRAILVIDRTGEIRLKRTRVVPGTLADALLFYAEMSREEDVPASPSRIPVLLLCDRSAPFRVLRPVLEACRHPEVRIRGISFGGFRGNTDFMWEIHTCLPVNGDVRQARCVRRIVLSGDTGPMPDHAALVAALHGDHQARVGAHLTVDGDASIQHLAELLSAINAAGIFEVDYVEAEVPETDPIVAVDSAPVLSEPR